MSSTYRHNPYPGFSVVRKAAAHEEEDEGMEGPHASGISDSERESVASRCSSPPPMHDGADEEGMGRRSTSHYFEALGPMLPFYSYYTLGASVRREDAERQGLVRLFVGQVPYHLEAEHVAWMLQLLSGRRVMLAEKIVRWTQSRKPCGCFHVYCAPGDVAALLSVDQAVLCEQDGMWVARDEAEKRVLVQHCDFLRDNKDARAPLMPYQLMTVQEATSSYQRQKSVDAPRIHPRMRASVHQINFQPARFSRVHDGDAPQFPTHANQLW